MAPALPLLALKRVQQRVLGRRLLDLGERLQVDGRLPVQQVGVAIVLVANGLVSHGRGE